MMISREKINSASLIIQILFYLSAGINHFVNPESYYPLIPGYLSNWQESINIISGFLEITLAVGLAFSSTRKIAGLGIVIMLIAFIPSHVWFITENLESVGPLQVTPLMAWIRLILIHPLLIWWAWSSRTFQLFRFK